MLVDVYLRIQAIGNAQTYINDAVMALQDTGNDDAIAILNSAAEKLSLKLDQELDELMEMSD